MTSLSPLGEAPRTVIAVHLNYRSRAAQRGRVPAAPSYFLKPSSSLCGSGTIERPKDCELLAFEGEIALVIGEPARNVSPESGWKHIEFITAANDFGVHDLKHADLGANLRSKGGDGYTPLGPRLIAVADIDVADISLTTWVNGEVAQATDMSDVIFDFGQLVADLSRLMTLQRGDVILTGTPAGSTVVQPGDHIEVEVTSGKHSSGRLSTTVVEADAPLAGFGAGPKYDRTTAEMAYGYSLGPSLDDSVRDALKGLSTATLSVALRKRGIMNSTVDGVHALRPDLKMVGTAKTLRYLPLREDEYATRGVGMTAQKKAVESLTAGDVLVMDARRESQAGTCGDILALRAHVIGAAGIVTDGAIRDYDAVAAIDMPVFGAAAHPSVLGRKHVPWDINVPIACGNALVQPGDVMVGDRDGVVVIPIALAAELIEEVAEQERQERFIAQMVLAGNSVDGLYPLGPAWKQRYQQWLAEGGQ